MLESIILGAIFIAAVIFTIRALRNEMKESGSCSCGKKDGGGCS